MMLSLNSKPSELCQITLLSISDFAGTKLKPISVGPYDSDSIAGMGRLWLFTARPEMHKEGKIDKIIVILIRLEVAQF